MIGESLEDGRHKPRSTRLRGAIVNPDQGEDDNQRLDLMEALHTVTTARVLMRAKEADGG